MALHALKSELPILCIFIFNFLILFCFVNWIINVKFHYVFEQVTLLFSNTCSMVFPTILYILFLFFLCQVNFF